MILLAAVVLLQALDSGDYYQHGMDLARAGQLEQARQEFLLGRAQAPLDKRFPIELAGVAYRSGHPADARRLLHAALDLDPADAYANSFLGTLYFQDGNLEAALKYWNRAGKPRLEAVRIESGAASSPPVSDLLLDRAIAFAPGDVLLRAQYLSTLAWLRSLGAMGSPGVALEAVPGERFDAVIRWAPSSRWVRLASAFRGLPLQTINGELPNIGHRAIDASASLRWDAQKRRAFTSLSGPLAGDPRRHFRLYAEARSETWNLRQPEDFRLRKIEGGASLRFIPTGRFSWETGLRLASRSYSGTQAFFSGFTAAQTASASYRLIDLPERGFTLDSVATAELGRAFSSSLGGVYSDLRASLFGDWIPAPNSPARYETSARLAFGRGFGALPFDEQYILGRSGDDAILLRGLAATSHGKKGSAPVGRQYALANLDFLRQIWKAPLLAVDAGVLLDLGRISQQSAGVPPGRLVVTPGVQLRARLSRGFAAGISYAYDVRNGGGTLNLSLSR